MDGIELGFPTADAANDPLRMRRTVPAEVSVGEPFTYTLELVNQSDATLRNVVVTESLASGFALDSASGNPEQNGDTLTWTHKSMAPGQMVKLQVTGKATGTGSLKDCATVTFVPYACLETQVVDAQLELNKVAPEVSLLCDSFMLVYYVSNPGTGVAKSVMLRDTLPEGLLTIADQREIDVNLGDIAAGKTVKFEVPVKATRSGAEIGSEATVTSGSDTASDMAATAIIKPILELVDDAPESLIFGRTYTYTLTLTNSGDGPAKDAVITDKLPDGATFVSASGNGSLNQARDMVTWSAGTLAPGQSKTVNVRIRPDLAGEYRHSASAKAYCADAVVESHVLKARGVPAILLEVIDLNDPIVVGEETVYRITVTNQGTAPGTNIQIVADLEKEAQFLAGTGTTGVSASGSKISFGSVNLDPKAQASWDVRVKAIAEGDVRFTVEMTSDQIDRPVGETEATNFYE